MALIPASQVKPMSDDDKWKQAKRLLPLIKYILPKDRDFAIYMERNNLSLSKEDSFILNQVQDEVTKLLVGSGLYEYNLPDNIVWLKKAQVDEDSELKHEILNLLYKNQKQFFRNEIPTLLNIQILKLDYLTENMKNDGAINKKDASSKMGKDYIIWISDNGIGMYLNDYYLQDKSTSSSFINIHNENNYDNSKKINVETNNGIISTSLSKKAKIKSKLWYETPFFKHFIIPLLVAVLAGLILYKLFS